jgi:hypothetical protein
LLAAVEVVADSGWLVAVVLGILRTGFVKCAGGAAAGPLCPPLVAT